MPMTLPFETAVDRHGATVLRVCRAVLGPGPDAEDAWSETFLAALPERQRLALAYHYLAGLPHTETAALIGGSADAVRRAASDGLRALRRQYAPTDPSTGDPR